VHENQPTRAHSEIILRWRNSVSSEPFLCGVPFTHLFTRRQLIELQTLYKVSIKDRAAGQLLFWQRRAFKTKPDAALFFATIF